ncbi:polyprenyl synthetase family protein [Fluviicola sp.]|uniref:polyprenyl synthetase family protein n=1 Tax=Fluviicola sp. TaxID=1917219 RepID=UPI002631199A|nr:polyprenyl synthetase family protein [Fluviicola sp.]
MKEFSEYIQFIEEEIAGINLDKDPQKLFNPLKYFLSLGGKRIRPMLTILGGNIFQIPKEESIHAALCIELFHNFSLVHDDIMDAAPVRRGKATIHTKWNPSVAILSGDVLFVEAYQQLEKYTDSRLPLLLKRFNETAVEVCEGQQLDMDYESRNDVTEAEYITMIRLKTSVLLGCALEFGAILANQNEETRARLYEFGVSLGIAFQIQDDILDLYGDPESFGKRVGGDILANKQTLLFIHARNVADSTHQKAFKTLLEMEADSAKIDFAKRLFQENGTLAHAKEKMSEYYQLAMENLNKLENDSFPVGKLHILAKNLMVRIN